MPRRADQDPPLPSVFTSQDARAAGLTKDQVRQRIRGGRWRVLARGVYTALPSPAAGDDFAAMRAEHELRAVAAALSFPGACVCLHSAAVGHGLPLWRPLPRDVAVNVPLGKWNGTTADVVVHRMTLASDHVETLRVPITTVARTCIDVGRLMSLADGLAVSDAALRSGLTTRGALEETALSTLDGRGRRRGLWVAAQANGLRESPAESASWAYFLQHCVELPQPQVVIRGRDGHFIARVDFWWEGSKVVGECDGRMKYQSPDDIYAEKRREDELRADGLTVIRWGPRDLATDGLAQRLRRFHS